jgi:hypothetical protein
MSSPDELLARNGGPVTNLDDPARAIIEEYRKAEEGQPERTAINVINLRVATGTSHDFSTESEEFRDQQAKLQKALGDDYNREEDRPTLNAILAMLGDWHRSKTVEERQEFIRTVTGGKNDDSVCFLCRETSEDGSEALCVFVNSAGYVVIYACDAKRPASGVNALISGAGEILEPVT